MMRISMNPGYLTEALIALRWDAQHVQLVYDRFLALAEAGEDHLDLARRLNPEKSSKPSWEPSPFVLTARR